MMSPNRRAPVFNMYSISLRGGNYSYSVDINYQNRQNATSFDINTEAHLTILTIKYLHMNTVVVPYHL